MRTGFYSKIAWEGIRKNKRLYDPYLLTGSVMVMMSYILFYLNSSEMVKHTEGGALLRTLLPMGSVVIFVFSLLFLFYSNSFLIRQRNREFGLYNILGMDKCNLGQIMGWETLFSGGIAIVGGLILGIAFSKFAELIMHNLIQEDIVYTLRIDTSSVGKTVVEYAFIYFLLLLHSLRKIHVLSPVELLYSNQTGERPPKANWFLAVVGVAVLAAAYYIALSIKQPLSAILWFLVAVIMVVIATYLLFIAGSVALCRLLQKNKRYYYKANHFVSVSSMSYRMKRNGAGLASICILITMVLVMLSTTLSMYIGTESTIATQYPRDIALRLYFPNLTAFHEEAFAGVRGRLEAAIGKTENGVEFSGIDAPGYFTEDGITVSYDRAEMYDYDRIGYLHMISLADYNRIMGQNETLEEDECLIYGYRMKYNSDTFTVKNCEAMKVKKVLREMYTPAFITNQVVPAIIMVVQDPRALVAPIAELKNTMEQPMLELYWSYDFDMNTDGEGILTACQTIKDDIHEIIGDDSEGAYSFSLGCREEERTYIYGTYATLFFIAILLSVVFLFAAVLIIYYKQISEGYEDQNRFEVMQKVGMTDRDIRRSVNSQVLTVFFAPLLLAGVHLAFAFPILWKMLMMFGFSDRALMIAVTASCFVVFALVYGSVYKITSNAYYTIVRGKRELT